MIEHLKDALNSIKECHAIVQRSKHASDAANQLLEAGIISEEEVSDKVNQYSGHSIETQDALTKEALQVKTASISSCKPITYPNTANVRSIAEAEYLSEMRSV